MAENLTGKIIESEFESSWPFRNRHIQTIYPNVLQPPPRTDLRRERLELQDGDFIDVDWTIGGDGPIVIVLHGLEGSINSRYAARIMQRVKAMGLRGALPHFRGCSGEPNRLSISYHSGFTQDLEYFTDLLKHREPHTSLAAVGYSLGGNVLLKWLGESSNASRLIAGVAVSVPFDLADASRMIEQGVSRIYKWSLLGRMRRSAVRKFLQVKPPFDLPDIKRIRTFREFDDKLTAPLHGFKNADEYYARCSSRHFLKYINVPTLILHAKDDPFMSIASIPRSDELSSAVTLELSRNGGHVGFINGPLLHPNMWLDDRICDYLQKQLC
jgi:uncharacterized protein